MMNAVGSARDQGPAAPIPMAGAARRGTASRAAEIAKCPQVQATTVLPQISQIFRVISAGFGPVWRAAAAGESAGGCPAAAVVWTGVQRRDLDLQMVMDATLPAPITLRGVGQQARFQRRHCPPWRDRRPWRSPSPFTSRTKASWMKASLSRTCQWRWCRRWRSGGWRYRHSRTACRRRRSSAPSGTAYRHWCRARPPCRRPWRAAFSAARAGATARGRYQGGRRRSAWRQDWQNRVSKC